MQNAMIASPSEAALVAALGTRSIVLIGMMGAGKSSIGRRLATRLELTGETAFCYANDPQPLLAELAHHPELRYLHRPANLEDLFIKLTGRELRD